MKDFIGNVVIGLLGVAVGIWVLAGWMWAVGGR